MIVCPTPEVPPVRRGIGPSKDETAVEILTSFRDPESILKTVCYAVIYPVTEISVGNRGALRRHREVTRATKQAPFAPLELAAGSPSHRLPDLYSRNLNRPESLGDPTGIVSRPTTNP